MNMTHAQLQLIILEELKAVLSESKKNKRKEQNDVQKAAEQPKK